VRILDRSTAGTGSGASVEGNARMTGNVAVVLLVLLAIQRAIVVISVKSTSPRTPWRDCRWCYIQPASVAMRMASTRFRALSFMTTLVR
jgi:hypothetical protein